MSRSNNDSLLSQDSKLQIIQLKSRIISLEKKIEKVTKEKNQIKENIEKSNYLLSKQKNEWKDKYVKKETELRRYLIKYNNIEEDIKNSQKLQINSIDSYKKIVKNFVLRENCFFDNLKKIQLLFKDFLFSFETKEKIDFDNEIISLDLKKLPEFEEKHLFYFENQNDNEKKERNFFENILKDLKPVYNRIFNEIEKIKKNNFFEKLEKDEMINNIHSPLPEEMKLETPDISALNFINTSNNNIGNSINFDLKEFLVLESNNNINSNEKTVFNRNLKKKELKDYFECLLDFLENNNILSKHDLEKCFYPFDKILEIFEQNVFRFFEEKEKKSKLVNDMQKKYLEFKMEFRNSEKEIKENNKKKLEYEQKKEVIIKKLKELDEKKIFSEQILEKEEIEYKKQNENFIELDSYRKNLEKEIEKLKKSTSEKKVVYEEMIKNEYSLKVNIDNENLRNEDYESRLSEKNELIKKIENKVFSIKEKNNNLSEKIKKIEIDLLNKNKNFEIYENKRKNLEYGKKEKNNLILNLGKEIVKLNFEISRLEKEDEILTKRLITEKMKFQDISKKKENLNEMENSKNQEYLFLKKKLKNIKKNIENQNNNNLPDNFKKTFENCKKLFDDFEIILKDLKKSNEKKPKLLILKKIEKKREKVKKIKTNLIHIKNDIETLICENNILKDIKSNLNTDLKNLNKKKNENEILNKYMKEENTKNRDSYINKILEELIILKNIKRGDNNKLDPNLELKVNHILKIIHEEIELKNPRQKNLNQRKLSMLEKKNTIETNELKSVNSLFLNNNSIISENIYNTIQKDYFSNKNDLLKNSKSKPLLKSRSNEHNSNFRFNNNRKSSVQSKSRKNESFEYDCYQNYEKKFFSSEKNELNENWQQMMKFFMKFLNSIFKSSCLLANSISLIIGKYCVKDKNYTKIKQCIMKFLNESLERHKTSFTQIAGYKNLKRVTVKALMSCLMKLKEIVVVERQIQDKFNKTIKSVIRPRRSFF